MCVCNINILYKSVKENIFIFNTVNIMIYKYKKWTKIEKYNKNKNEKKLLYEKAKIEID